MTRPIALVLVVFALIVATAGPGGAAPGPEPGNDDHELSSFSSELTDGYGIAIDADGNVFVADQNGQVVRKITPAGVASIVAGNGVRGSSGDGGQATSAEIDVPRGLAVDADGNIYIAEYLQHRIRKVAPNGIISTFAGTGVGGFSGDGGQAAAAQLSLPHDIEVDSAGNVYVSDWLNHRIRKIAPDGTISTFAGTGVSGFSGDGGQATAAQLANPRTMAIDGDDNLFVFEWGTKRVRRIASDGTVSTVAGNGLSGNSGDGGPATSASLDDVKGITVDDVGNLYISSEQSDIVRRVGTDGIIATLAGNGVEASAGDGGPLLDAQFRNPRGLAVRPDGTLLVVEGTNVRAIAPDTAAPVVTLAAPAAAQRFGSRASATFACVDGALASCTATLNGSSYASGAAIPTSANESAVVVVTGVDNAGNTTTETTTVAADWNIYGPYAAASGNAGIVVRFYVATFGRLPDAEGFAFWRGLLDDDPSALVPVSAFFTTSTEFGLLYGDSVTDEEFVTTIYTNVLGRPPEIAGRAFWAGAIADGSHTRASVMSFFAQSPEHKLITATS